MFSNLPEGVYSWELDAPEHYARCEELNKECICDAIEEEQRDLQAEAQMEMERGN